MTVTRQRLDYNIDEKTDVTYCKAANLYFTVDEKRISNGFDPRNSDTGNRNVRHICQFQLSTVLLIQRSSVART